MSIQFGLVVAAVAEGVLGLALLLLGRWAVGAADRLLTPDIEVTERDARRRSYVLGARACQVIGAAIALFAIATAVAAVVGVGPTLRPQ